MSGPTILVEQRSARMRDGATLASDVYRPPTGRHPAILMRTPYDRTALGERARELNLRSAVERGYAVVIQDVRGRYASGGEFRMLMPDVEDGADTIGWIRCQPWSDGRVVMIGSSYDGCVQFAAARSRPAGLMAIAPTVSGALRTIWHEGETVKLAGLDSWLIGRLREQRAQVEDSAATAIDQLLAADPVSRYHALLDRESSAWALGEAVRHVLSGRAGDDFWGAAAALPAEPLPAIHASGWYDSCLTASVEAFEGWQAAGGAPQQLLVGPWGHELSTVHYPPLGLTGPNTPPPSVVQEAQMDFFDAVLGRGSRSVGGCVTTWVLGANRWQHGEAWPPLSTCAVPIMLGGDAAPALSPDAGERGLVQFAYDPADPVPTLGGVQESTGHLGLGSASQVNEVLGALPKYEFNLAAAKRELAKSAYPHGFTTSIQVEASSSSASVIAQSMASNLAKIGITAKIQELQPSEAANLSATAWRNVKIALTEYTYNYPDPEDVMVFILASSEIGPYGTNAARYRNPEVDKLLQEEIEALNPTRRLHLIGKLLKIVATEAPYVPLYTRDLQCTLSNRYVLPTFSTWTPEMLPWALDVKLAS